MSKFVKYKHCCVVNMDQVSYFNMFPRSIRFFHNDSEEHTEWRLSSKEESEYVYELLLNLTNTVVLKDF